MFQLQLESSFLTATRRLMRAEWECSPRIMRRAPQKSQNSTVRAGGGSIGRAHEATKATQTNQRNAYTDRRLAERAFLSAVSFQCFWGGIFRTNAEGDRPQTPPPRRMPVPPSPPCRDHPGEVGWRFPKKRENIRLASKKQPQADEPDRKQSAVLTDRVLIKSVSQPPSCPPPFCPAHLLNELCHLTAPPANG